MFGINGSGNQQDGPAPGDGGVVPAPSEPTASDSSAPIMPSPIDGSSMGGSASGPPSDVVSPVVTPSMPIGMPEPQQETAHHEASSAPPVPQETVPEHTSDSSSGINGVSPENAYSSSDPSMSSDYSSPKASDTPIVSGEHGEELLSLKQRALQSLAPLVDELDQTPEEKFKTTMMLIQASDNADLVKEAFVAANAITDEKTRAQALLDVVNEINYFTHPHPDSDAP